jgi:Fe-S cluster biogenesis protein NfuA
MTEGEEFRQRVGRIDGLIQEIESVADPAIRAMAKELVQCVMDMHAAGIQRILEIVLKAGEPGAAILSSMGHDELVSSLLVLYDLHPDDFETRVNRGLERASSLVAKRGGAVELLSIVDGTVHIRVSMTGHSCGSTAKDLELIVRETLFATVPDAVTVIIDGPGSQSASGFVPLANLQVANGPGTPAAFIQS